MKHDIFTLPEWSRAWAEKRLDQHVKLGRSVSLEQWNDMRDWLRSILTERPKMQGKLYKLTLEQALTAVDKWHAAMATKSARLVKEHGSFSGDSYAVEDVLVLQGGLRWVRILTPEGLDYEGTASGVERMTQ